MQDYIVSNGPDDEKCILELSQIKKLQRDIYETANRILESFSDRNLQDENLY